jgi:hypothetical protein
VLYVDPDRLLRLNEIEGITAATRAAFTVINPRQTVATIKVIPFAIPESQVRLAEAILAEGGPLLDLRPLPSRRVALILSASPQARERVGANFIPPVQKRVEAFGSQLSWVTTLSSLEGSDEDSTGELSLISSIQKALEAGAEVIVLAGETAVMDRQDIAPRAVEGLGGQVVLFGAPVDPGSLLMLAYVGNVPVLGAPGCARSLKPNIIDWVLPRLLVGERLSRGDILVLGHGGLLEGLQEGVSWRERLPED